MDLGTGSAPRITSASRWRRLSSTPSQAARGHAMTHAVNYAHSPMHHAPCVSCCGTPRSYRPSTARAGGLSRILHCRLPTNTYRIWKCRVDLRADTTLAGFNGLRIRHADHSFLFVCCLPPGSLLVLHSATTRCTTLLQQPRPRVTRMQPPPTWPPCLGLNISSTRHVLRTTWLCNSARRREYRRVPATGSRERGGCMNKSD